MFIGLVFYVYFCPSTDSLITLYLLWSATSTLRSANGFSPRNVVRCFSSSKGISNRSLAIHSSAKELDTTLTPVKSRTTFSSPLMSGRSFCRSFCPMSRVPKSVPYSMNLNSTITFLILLIQQMFHYILQLHRHDGRQSDWDQSLFPCQSPCKQASPSKSHFQGQTCSRL